MKNGVRKVFFEVKVVRVFVIVFLMFVLSYFLILFYIVVVVLGYGEVVLEFLIDFLFFCVVFGFFVNLILYLFMKLDF